MIVRPSIAFSGFSGSAKGVTARSVRGGTVLSSKSQHSSITTPAQAASRSNLSRISRSYKQLSDSQMKGWETLAGHLKGISTFGRAAEMTAHNAYVRINTNRILAGLPALKSAPAYTSDVPEVDYEDFWVTPERIVFVGLNTPSEHHRLVVKMSRSTSGGVSAGGTTPSSSHLHCPRTGTRLTLRKVTLTESDSVRFPGRSASSRCGG